MPDGGRGGWMVRGWLLGAGLLALGVAGVLWALDGEDAAGPMELSERTDLIAMVCAVIGGAAVLATLWRRPEEDSAAAVARLARAVRAVGEPQWSSSLGGDLKAIDVTFAFRPYGTGRAAELPASPAGRLEKVVDDYRALRPRRMVITGEPGAGKTILARKFVMELNRVRTESEPVPVLISLADWGGGESFVDWLTRHLQRDFGLRAVSARSLVDARMVLPVLDGLDEMDGEGEVGLESRAGRALEALARYQDGIEPGPLVLTCRTREYDQLEAAGGHILDAARLEIAPVTADQAVRYLEQRGAARRPAEWAPVLAELRAYPGGVLARALSTPWRLTLAAVAYDRAGDPAEMLTAVREREVADRLLARFIGALTSHAPSGAGRCSPDRIHRRLAVLAAAMTTAHGADSDLVLEQLAGRLRRGWAKAVHLAVCLVCAAAAGTAIALNWEGAGIDLMMAVLMSGMLALAAMHVVDSAPRLLVFTRFAVPPFGSPLWRVGWAASVRVGRTSFLLPCGVSVLAVWFLGSPRSWGGAGAPHMAIALTGFLGVLLSNFLVDKIELAAFGPSAWARMGAATAAATAMMALLVPGGAWARPDLPVVLFPLGAFGLVFIALAGPWCLYVCALLTHRPRLPFRLARFLDWSVSAGLMRTSGVAYQFRHREFQEWLVRHPAP
ncbi:NACHT domain-containing protein [Streptomyces narbonensis]|uniref:NACHT domain-containing protein n=1 Tax=Streptomyces narbonensis TaxID=67333 RepID=UPI0033E5F9E7